MIYNSVCVSHVQHCISVIYIHIYIYIYICTYIFWRRKWQPTPVLLPGEFHGQRSLVGYSLPGHKDSDTTERLTFQILTVYQAQRRNGLLRTLLHFGQSEPLFSSFRTLISFQKTPCLPLGQMGEASSAQLRAL